MIADATTCQPRKATDEAETGHVLKILVPGFPFRCSRLILHPRSHVRELAILAEPVALSGVEMAQLRADPAVF